MKKVQYPQTSRWEIPKGKSVMLIRNDYMYFHNGGSIFVRANRNTDNLINESQLVDTDRIYVLNDETDIVKTVTAGRCLETFRLKKGVSKLAHLVKLLKDGQFLGYQSSPKEEKFMMKLNERNHISFHRISGNSIVSVGTVWVDDFGPDTYSNNILVGNEFEFWKWFTQ